jgi:DNA (cytosine-5)-methyltransferase 1
MCPTDSENGVQLRLSNSQLNTDGPASALTLTGPITTGARPEVTLANYQASHSLSATEHPFQPLRAISLFSGVGGFEIGFDRAGIETILQVEQDPYCLSVLARHWPETERINDVRDVHGPHGVDLCFGGFPCQDVSVAGQRSGLDGERSGLWFEFLRVLSELRPRWAVIENVVGLLSNHHGQDFATVLGGLAELGYGVGWRTWDAKYFLVPQQRRRVFIVAHLHPEPGIGAKRAAEVLALCESCGGDSAASRKAGQTIARTLTAGAHPHSNHPRRHREDDDNLVITTANTLQARYGKGVNGHWAGLEGDDTLIVSDTLRSHPRPGSNSLGNLTYPLARRGRDEGLSFEIGQPEVMNALRAAAGGSSQQPEIIGPFGVRRLMPIECERIMGWPSDWTRWGNDGTAFADTHRYRMIGNGVVATVAEYIGHRLVWVDAHLGPLS